MGEDIFNFVLSDINGIPALPVFIGNYLLDLLSTFFPIFMLLSSFVMVYIGFTRGSGDWKATAQQVAPTAVSMAVIMGLLSMKTPYTASDSAAVSGDFWKDTNSYTVVEMMNTFLGFGNIFADALTHKIIYGSIDVSDGKASEFNGYFPAVLQAMIDKDGTTETKKFLIDKAKREDIVQAITVNNDSLAAEVKTIATNLSRLGIVDDYKKPRGDNKENVDNDSSAYSNTLKDNFVIKSTYGNNMLFKFAEPRFPSEGDANKVIESNTDMLEEKNKQKSWGGYQQGLMYKPNSGWVPYEVIDFAEKVKPNIDPNDPNGTPKLNITETLKAYGKDKKGSMRVITRSEPEEMLAYMAPDNFEQEMNMINSSKNMLTNYKKVYDLYTDEISSLENKMKDAKTEEEKVAYKRSLNNYKTQQVNIKNQTLNIASLYKDFVLIMSSIGGGNVFDDTVISDIDSIAGVGTYNSLPNNSHFNEKELIDLYAKANNGIGMERMTTFTIDNDKKNREQIVPVLNDIMKSKAYISTMFYDKYKDVLKDDVLFQAALGFKSDSAYVRVFLPENDQNALKLLDEKRDDIITKNTINGETSVSKSLKKAMDENKVTVSQESKAGKAIHWTDLGKYYATFKNLYSPMITNIYTMQAANSVDYTKAASIAQFMSNLEPSNKTDRLLDAAAMYAGASGVTAIANKTASKLIGSDQKDGSFGSFWDVIKIVGGMYFAIYFVNVILPAFIWMFVIITYYVEMSIYVAVFPIGFMFMIFQSYRQSLHQYINMLLGFILMPIILVSMYFIILYIDMLLPMFFKQFLPFFATSQEFSNSFSLAFGSSDSILTNVMGGVVNVAKDALDATITDTDLTSMIGNFVYTLLSMVMSVLLLMTFFRANEYMSKILNVSTVGMDSFSGKETINKFGGFDKSGLTASIAGR